MVCTKTQMGGLVLFVFVSLLSLLYNELSKILDQTENRLIDRYDEGKILFLLGSWIILMSFPLYNVGN